MKKKAISLLLVCTLLVSILTGFKNASASTSETVVKAKKTESVGKNKTKDTNKIIMGKNDPDFSTMTSAQWMAYEFHMDYATLFSDVTSYSHEYLRQMLDMHWSTYLSCVLPTSTLTEAEKIKAITALHNARMNAKPIGDTESKRIYLWPKGKVPTVTEYTKNAEYAYADDPGFEPFMLASLVKKGTKIKGAVIIAAGGGHNYRSNVEEGYEVSKALNDLGYQCFIVNYRVNPYTDDESALDVTRAIKMVRYNAKKYGVDPNKIACAGFSWGGIVTSLAADKYDSFTNASALVKDYVPDKYDSVSGTMNTYLAIYSVTPDKITNKNFPPTFFAFGGDDGIWDWVMRCFRNCLDLGIRVEMHTFSGVPHGFGAGTHADGTVYSNASKWPSLADAFMQDVYADPAPADNATN